MTCTMVVLLFVLQINETVTINNGEIVATNPQSDYKAPYEAQIIKVIAKEGAGRAGRCVRTTRRPMRPPTL